MKTWSTDHTTILLISLNVTLALSPQSMTTISETWNEIARIEEKVGLFVIGKYGTTFQI